MGSLTRRTRSNDQTHRAPNARAEATHGTRGRSTRARAEIKIDPHHGSTLTWPGEKLTSSLLPFAPSADVMFALTSPALATQKAALGGRGLRSSKRAAAVCTVRAIDSSRRVSLFFICWHESFHDFKTITRDRVVVVSCSSPITELQISRLVDLDFHPPPGMSNKHVDQSPVRAHTHTQTHTQHLIPCV